MAHYKGHIPEDGVKALKALIGSRLGEICAPELEVYLDGYPTEARQLVLAVDARKSGFVTISTDWFTSEFEFDYHTYVIERSQRPGRIPYKGRDDTGPGGIGPTSSVHVDIGKLESIEIIEAHCITNLSDADPEIVDYDRCLRFIGSSGNVLLCTDYDSIMGAIEISKKDAPEPEDMIESYRVRLSLGPIADNRD